MSIIKIEAWIDSGANINSCRKVTFEVDSEEWESMSEEEKDEYSKEYSWDRMDWGWRVKQ